jgi:hypothetical protein
MGTLNIQRFANKLSEKVRTNELVDLGKIARDVGYSNSLSKTPQKITNTKTFKLLTKPLLDGLHEQVKQLQLSIKDTSLDDYDLRSKVYAYDIMVKNYQLLSGGATERQVFVLPSEVMNKNNIIQSNTSDTLSIDSKSLPS